MNYNARKADWSDHIYIYELDDMEILFSGLNDYVHITIQTPRDDVTIPLMTREQAKMLIAALEAAIVKSHAERRLK